MGGAPLLLRVLGPVQAEIAGTPVDLGGPQQRAVLARLLVARGEVVSVDRIIDDLWHGEPPPRAIGALQAYVSNLRRAIEPERAPRTPATVLVSAPPGYAIHVGSTDIDVLRFEELLRAATDAHDDADAAGLLADALRRWRGAAFGEFTDRPWAEAEVARLEELRYAAREQLIERLASCGRAAEGIAAAESLVRDAPLRDTSWRLLALSQYVAGRQADALATLRRARERLADELGVDPGPALATLERDILNHTVVSETRAMVPAPEPAALIAQSAVFIGRRHEQAALRECAASARPGQPAVAVIAGEAGAGKSALLGRLRARLVTDGWRVLVGRCPELTGGPPAWAMSEALRSLAADVDPGRFAQPLAPLLTDAPIANGEGSRGQFLMHRAVCAWLDVVHDRPLAILLDDLHRADTETVRVILSVITSAPTTRILFVLAHRPEHTPRLDELLGGVAPHSPLRISLGGLSMDEANNLLTIAAGFPVSYRALELILDRTDGNPFFVAELGRLIASEGETAAIGDVPMGVSDVVRRRVARLPQDTITVLRIASVVGRTVDVDLVMRASGLVDDVVLTGLEAGVIDGLLVEDEPGVLRFAHVLVRDAIYAGISKLRRRAWHAAVASTLDELDPSDISAIAHHSAESATPTTAHEAAERCMVAAARAKERYAYDAAADLYTRALRCLELAGAAPGARADVAMLRVAALVLSGQVDAVLPARNELLELARASDDATVLPRALVAGTLPSAWPDRPYLDVDLQLIAELDACLAGEISDARLSCLLLVTRVRESAYSDDPRTNPAAEEAVRLARALDDPELLALALVAQSETIDPVRDGDRYRACWTELRSIAEGNSLYSYALMADFKELSTVMLEHDPARSEVLVDRTSDLTHKLQLGRAESRVALLRAAVPFMRGDLERAAARYDEALILMKRATPRDGVAMELVTKVALAIVAQKSTADTADQLQFIFDYNPPFSYVLGGALACALLSRGDRDAARDVLVRMPALVDDMMRSLWLSYQGLAWVELDDREGCAQIYEGLLPYAGQVAGMLAAFPLVPVDLVLASLCRVMDARDDARSHLAVARDITDAWGNDVWRALLDREALGVGS